MVTPVVTLLITMYLPVSRNAIEMLLCAKVYAETFDSKYVPYRERNVL